MKRVATFTLLLLLSSPCLGWAGGQTTYDVISRGMSCSQNSMGSTECVYKVGDDCIVTIAGVGDGDAAIVIDRSLGIEGDYYPRFVTNLSCFAIVAGEKTFDKEGLSRLFDTAFISPKTGKVYRDWMSCK